MNWTPEFLELVRGYQDEAGWYPRTYAELDAKVIAVDWLVAHREWIVSHGWGMGDRAHWWIWKLLCEQMPSPFKFLEIGVYRGSILSLMALIGQKIGKETLIYGVTPLKATSDANYTYPETNTPGGWAVDVKTSFDVLAPGCEQPTLMIGYSSEPNIIEMARGFAPYDILYIDGGHDYHQVVEDIQHYCPMVRSGGLLIMDDASCLINVPRTGEAGGWTGYESVSTAVRDALDSNPEWSHLFAVSHNRVYYHGPRSDFV